MLHQRRQELVKGSAPSSGPTNLTLAVKGGREAPAAFHKYEFSLMEPLWRAYISQHAS